MTTNTNLDALRNNPGVIKVAVFPAKANPKASLREKMDEKYGRNK